MFTSIRNRLILIAILVVAAIVALIPRKVTSVIRDPVTGIARDSVYWKSALSLGLDLQGGMHLALELDQSKQVSSDVKRDIDLALTILRKRIDQFGVAEPLIQKQGDERIVVELAAIKDPERAKQIVQQSAFLEFRMTDEAGAFERALPAIDRQLRTMGIRAPGDATPRPSAVQQLLGGGDTAKADSTKADSAKTPADSAADAAGGLLGSLIQRSDMPGEYLVPETAYPRVDSLLNLPEIKRLLPRGIDLRWASAPISIGVQSYLYLYALEDKSLVTGDRLVDARAELDPITNGPQVNFELDRAGGRRFGEGTGRHVGDYMAIVLDGRVQGRPPVIQSRIERSGRIMLGGRTIQEAQDLALTLRAGALPIPLKIVEQGEVGASLGDDSIKAGITAGIAGTILVIFIMIGYYAWSGVLAVVGLGLYILLTLGALALMDATLTLPGLAGLVLSIGIAVDANVLIFERIREELALGKTVRLASDEGFHRAMNAIVDSNVCAVVTALFLFQFGTGPVRGFAVTLIVGTLASMVTAIFITRTFFLMWLSKRSPTAPLSI